MYHFMIQGTSCSQADVEGAWDTLSAGKQEASLDDPSCVEATLADGASCVVICSGHPDAYDQYVTGELRCDRGSVTSSEPTCTPHSKTFFV